MKKNQIFALLAFSAVGVFFSSCTSSVSTKAPLVKDVDSVSYAYGASIYRQGLSMTLEQMGIIGDTSSVRYQYQSKLSKAKDKAAKAVIEKEIANKIDSINVANSKNSAAFLKGMNESLHASGSQSAYFTGLAIGQQLAKNMFPRMVAGLYGQGSNEKLNSEAFLAGLATMMMHQKAQIENPDNVIRSKMEAAGKIQQAKHEAELKKQYKSYIDENTKFLADNKAKKGVVTLPSGVQYKIVKQGHGPKPKATDVVKVNYKGTLIDGTEFDNSYKRKAPASFEVDRVIKGWTEALQLMPVGSKWTLYIPADKGYGAQSTGKIKPFSTLVFDVELLSIDTKKK